jgi:hypothetical protein
MLDAYPYGYIKIIIDTVQRASELSWSLKFILRIKWNSDMAVMFRYMIAMPLQRYRAIERVMRAECEGSVECFGFFHHSVSQP